MSEALKSRYPFFNVQKHQASHLHNDFLVDIGGLVKSWAILKGPSLGSSVKRLAVQVHGHSLDNANWEGGI